MTYRNPIKYKKKRKWSYMKTGITSGTIDDGG